MSSTVVSAVAAEAPLRPSPPPPPPSSERRELITLGVGGANWSGDPRETLGLVGASPVLARLRADIRDVAAHRRPVLVLGPTGGGKELVVRALAGLGTPDAPLVDINCGAIPETLMESQLFGHERGAFTDAHAQKDGYFAAVGEGTLFLDEVGELPLGLQAKLLRVLETQKFCRVGSVKPLEFRGRIVAATHVDLAAEVERGRFRRDLYFRLDVLRLTVPALEQHRQDIPQLIAHFCRQERRALVFTADALAMLMQRRWPGNVRELRNVVDRLLCRVKEQPITGARLGELLDEAPRDEAAALDDNARAIIALGLPRTLRATLHALVNEALRQTGNNKTAAARLLGVHRKAIERLARRCAVRDAAAPILDVDGGEA